jgi:hypothetical protein
MSEKILIASRSMLIAKYTKPGFDKVAAAVKVLIAADKKRGLNTSLIFLDDPVAMRRHKGSAVTDPKSGQQHKEAIDAICKSLQPQYLVILDAPDIIPHVSMQNPTPDDDDPDVPSDLPYACDAPFSRDPRKFLSITRVVGRIPGIMGADRPTFLTDMLKAAASFNPRPRKDYLSYFAISAEVWQKSTAKSLDEIFGKESDSKILVSPPTVNSGANRHLSPLMHFINCHGDTISPNFFGQRGEKFPIALTSDGVGNNASSKTVVAAECCYGAELYDPKREKDEKPPIAISYFSRGAVGFFGSTNTAYGEATRMGAADILTQYFLIQVLGGASLGRACLRARQKFVDTEDLDIFNLKTIAQFILLGDPSLQPCLEDPDEAAIEKLADPSAARRIRRMELSALGKSAGESSAFGGKKERNPAKKLATRAKSIARKLGVKPHKIESFDVSGGPLYRNSMRSHQFRPRMVVVSEKSKPIQRTTGEHKRPIRDIKAVVIHTHNGGVARIAHYLSR